MEHIKKSMKYVNGTNWIIRIIFFTVKGFYFRKKNDIMLINYTHFLRDTTWLQSTIAKMKNDDVEILKGVWKKTKNVHKSIAKDYIEVVKCITKTICGK